MGAARRPIAPLRRWWNGFWRWPDPEGKYHDLNVCHLQELLEHEEQITIGRSTLDRVLKAAGLKRPRHLAQDARARNY